MSKNSLISVPFFESMSNSHLFDVEYAQKDKDWQMLKQLYDKNYLDKVGKKFGGYKVPKKIHQIWLGSELPEKCRSWGETWKKLHPDWEYRLWTDKEAKDFRMINRDIFDKVSNWGAKADIFRLEILYKYGGLYVDTDFECLKSFDEICKMTDLFFGLAYSKNVEMYNGLIGVSRKNPVIAAYMTRIKKAFVAKQKLTSSDDVMEQTGPYSFTKTYLECVRDKTVDSIPFPVTFFYCFPNSERQNINDREKVRSYVRPESYAIHYWSVAWIVEQNIWGKLGTFIKKILNR